LRKVDGMSASYLSAVTDDAELRFEKRMSDSDALMWRIETDPVLRSTITSVAIYDRAIPRDRVWDRVDRASRMVPRLRQRVLGAPLSPSPPRWVVDEHFDLKYHLRFVTAPGGGTMRDLLDLAEPLAMQSFDRARPLWEFVVVEGLEHGRAAVNIKVHHAITDGVGGVKLMMSLLDLSEEEPDLGPMPAEPQPDAPSWTVRIVDSAEHERRRQAGIAQRVLGHVGRLVTRPGEVAPQAIANVQSMGRVLAPAFEPLSPVLTGRSLSVRFDPITLPVPELKAAAKVADAKLNDAFLAGVAGGLRRYHAEHGATVDALRMSMPINVRTSSTEGLAGNQFVPARFPIPLAIEDPVERMRVMRALVAEQRGEPSLGFVEGIAGVLNRLPRAAVTELFGRMLKGIDFVTSNVPGVPIPVYFAGAKLEAQFPFGPLAGSAMNVTLLSYVDEAQIGVNTDPAAVPDPEVLVGCLTDAFDEIRKLA
jgi:WS/DGAT/MGAT family acyltransferase